MAINPQFKFPSAKSYAAAAPFPHAVMDGMWRDGFLGRVSDAVSEQNHWDGEKKFYGSVAKRWCSTWERLPRPVERLINLTSRPAFIKHLEALTGEEGLVPDPYLQGAGIHSTGHGGFLKMHADFNWHKQLQLYRRLNLLVYLNKGWEEKWGGNLDLARIGDDDELIVEKTVFPHFNTTVLFTTDDQSFHGQPTPMDLPEGVTRNSIALYYYVARKPETLGNEKRLGTDYRQLSGSKLTRRSTV